MKDKISASEALYGFCGWLTTRDEVVELSSTKDAAPIAELIGRFCTVNKLQEPRVNYTDYYILPKEKKF